MKKIIIPNTDLHVSRLGFGTASLHHLLTEKSRQLLLHSALDLDFTYFDTARMYGDGMSERSLGKLLSPNLRANVVLSSKIGIPALKLYERYPLLMYAQRAFNNLPVKNLFGLNQSDLRLRSLEESFVEESLTASLNSIKTDWLDILFIHEANIMDIPALNKLTNWLFSQKKSGKVRYLGLSGDAYNCKIIIDTIPNLFDVLQVKDSLRHHEAKILSNSGLPLQFTYGYMRSAYDKRTGEMPPILSGQSILKAALDQNTSGSILTSSKRITRIKEFAEVVD